MSEKLESPIEENEVRTPPSETPTVVDILDGGFVAWLQVFGVYFIFMNTWYATLVPGRVIDSLMGHSLGALSTGAVENFQRFGHVLIF